MDRKYKPKKLYLKGHDCGVQSKNEEESTDQNESDLPPLEGDEEEVKERKGSKSSTSNKLLTRLPILLQQIKVGNNLYKLKNEIRKILYLLYQHHKIKKKKKKIWLR